MSIYREIRDFYVECANTFLEMKTWMNEYRPLKIGNSNNKNREFKSRQGDE